MLAQDLVATLGWGLLVAGWAARRNRRRHLSLVIPGMLVDLGLVVHLEITRSVIERTVTESYTLVQRIHIATSSAAVLLYLPTIALGTALALGRGGPAVRVWHKRCALPALVLRTVGFGFMWTV